MSYWHEDFYFGGIVDLHKMKLHEEEHISVHGKITSTVIVRVPGGWIYHLMEHRYIYSVGYDWQTITSTFVPFNNEFMNKESES